MAGLNKLVSYTNTLLDVDSFSDYAPNGLQVEGKNRIQRIVTGVTASLDLIEAAIKHHADAVLVHHGYFWKNEAPEITGMKYQRIKALMDYDISLLAYHLPLDAHPELGNNAQLANRLGMTIEGKMNAQGIGNVGSLSEASSVQSLSDKIEQELDRKPLVISGGDHPIKKIALCTGGAQSYIDDAIASGADAFITGEISESTVHIARESGIHYFAAGHHATERYGVQALGDHLKEVFDLEHYFVDCNNPV